jgi:hypothetical protein
MGTSKTRQEKLAFLKHTIDSYFLKYPNGKIDARKLLSEFVMAQNSTKRTGLEILMSLVDTKYIKLNEGIITQ